MSKKPVCKLARPLLGQGKCVIYELLSGVARCTGYEPLQIVPKIQWRDLDESSQLAGPDMAGCKP